MVPALRALGILDQDDHKTNGGTITATVLVFVIRVEASFPARPWTTKQTRHIGMDCRQFLGHTAGGRWPPSDAIFPKIVQRREIRRGLYALD